MYRLRAVSFVSGASTWVLGPLVSVTQSEPELNRWFRAGVVNAMRTTDVGFEVHIPASVVCFDGDRARWGARVRCDDVQV